MVFFFGGLAGIDLYGLVVASIEETAERYHIPKPFIGLILLPIVVSLPYPPNPLTPLIHPTQANAAEHVTSIWMALKNKMELTIGICVGSSIQIASFVIPLLVIVGWLSGHELTLFFSDFEVSIYPQKIFFRKVLLIVIWVDDHTVWSGVIGQFPRSRWQEQLYGRIIIDHALSRHRALL